MNVGILVFPDVEILDFTGPFEVFSVTTRVSQCDRDPEVAPYKAFFVAETTDIVSARYGFQVKPHYSFSKHPHVDLLLVPGGIMDQPRGSPETVRWIQRTAATADLVTSVCTGAFLLAQAGLLDGLRATTHWEDVAALRQEFPAVRVMDDQVWVDEGRVVTSAGIAAGIDMCLHLVARLQDEELARTAARQMVYTWRPEPVRSEQAA